ncbi:RNA-directed DNA polymerase, eukaryota [Tanacetum coccineum]
MEEGDEIYALRRGGGGDEDEEPNTSDPGALINLKVKGQDGSEVFFRIRRSTQLKKLMIAYCDRKAVELNLIVFLFDGRFLRGEDTAHELKMKEGDEIYAMHRLTGGGLWVMIELESAKTKLNLMNHVGVASWFRSLCNAQSDFVAKERIVWVDIEGVPLHAWSRSTFFKIGSKWGDVLELEDDHDDLFAHKRLCIKTKHEENILESFKIIVKGKVFCVRAKELFVWNLTFKDIPEAVHCSDDESIKGEAEMNDEDSKLNNDGDASDSEVVS